MQKSSWYRTWFDSPYYPILYRDRDEREAALFIDRIFKYFMPPRGAHFLDLACGRGRHSIYMHKKGYPVTGVDLSEASIAEARQHETDGLAFYVHDMREAFRPGTFDYVFNLFTSFGYFETFDENEAVLIAANKNLKAKGYLLIDFLNAEEVIQNLVIREDQEIDGVHFHITRSYENGRILKNIHIRDGEKRLEFTEKVQALTRSDFAGMLARAGFAIHDTFGNYHLEKFNPSESPRLIIIARKTN